MKNFYTAEDVASLLDLNVRTVRRYIREGRLKAARVGKQYRIAGADLSEFVGLDTASDMPQQARHALASSIVDIDGVDGTAASRISTLVQAVPMTAGNTGTGRVDCLYYEDAQRLRIAINADLGFTTSLLRLIETVFEDSNEERV